VVHLLILQVILPVVLVEAAHLLILQDILQVKIQDNIHLEELFK